MEEMNKWNHNLTKSIIKHRR